MSDIIYTIDERGNILENQTDTKSVATINFSEYRKDVSFDDVITMINSPDTNKDIIKDKILSLKEKSEQDKQDIEDLAKIYFGKAFRATVTDYKIATLLKHVSDNKSKYEFNSSEDMIKWVSNDLGYGNIMAYKMINIAEKLIDKDNPGHTIFAKYLPENQDFSRTQAIELLSLVSSDIDSEDKKKKNIESFVEKIKKGEVSNKSKKLEIRAMVKKIKDPDYQEKPQKTKTKLIKEIEKLQKSNKDLQEKIDRMVAVSDIDVVELQKNYFKSKKVRGFYKEFVKLIEDKDYKLNKAELKVEVDKLKEKIKTVTNQTELEF